MEHVYVIIIEGIYKGKVGILKCIKGLLDVCNNTVTVQIDSNNFVNIPTRYLTIINYTQYLEEKRKQNMFKASNIYLPFDGVCLTGEITWKRPNSFDPSTIKDVIFNNPATIILWKDGTKTVVKCQEGDTFNPELGFLAAVMKKLCGNKGNYNDVIKKWVYPEEKKNTKQN